MAKTKKKVLFITLAANSTGSNICLLHFLRWVKENADISFLTLFGNGGDLEKDFAELSDTIFYDKNSQQDSFFGKGKKKVFEHLGVTQQLIKNRIKREKVDLIFVNSVVLNYLSSMFYDLDIPIITHCLELESAIQVFGIEEFRELKNHTSHFIAISNASKQNLVKKHEIFPENVSVVNGFIPIEETLEGNLQNKKNEVCKELNIPENSFIVGASGTLNWRKSPEMFIQIAKSISEKSPDAPIYFIWVGGGKKGDIPFYEANFDVEKLNLQNKVFFLEHTLNPIHYFAAIDVFAMVSREEPLGLVCLESGVLGKPIICFSDIGGTSEIIGNDGGFVVPYLDIDAFSEKILELYSSPELKEKMGQTVAKRIKEKYSATSSAPKMFEIVEKYLNQ